VEAKLDTNMKTNNHSLNGKYYIIALTSAFLFCSKGFFIKGLYSEGFDAVGSQALRVLFAFPFYFVALCVGWKSIKNVARKDMIIICILGFFSYFLASILSFKGLELISVGLERLILFAYPIIVLIGNAIFLGEKQTYRHYLACVGVILGLFFVIQDEIKLSNDPRDIVIGSLLVFSSTVTYAAYLLVAKPIITRVGSQTVTTMGMTFSSLFVFVYAFGVEQRPIMPSFETNVILLGVAIAVFGTVLPTYLTSYSLSKISSSSHSIISVVAPVIVIAIANVIDQKTPTVLQILGMVITIGGSFLAGFKPNK